MAEYFRPWKLFSFAIGVALMLIGASYRLAPDWDIPISLIMPTLTYLTAPWSIRVLMSLRWTLWPGALFAVWFTVDGCYWLYWHLVNPAALEAMRSSNWPVSFPLYFFCGMLWLYRGSLKDLASELRDLMHARNRKPAEALEDTQVVTNPGP
jgi:hypothetical protein